MSSQGMIGWYIATRLGARRPQRSDSKACQGRLTQGLDAVPGRQHVATGTVQRNHVQVLRGIPARATYSCPRTGPYLTIAS